MLLFWRKRKERKEWLRQRHRAIALCFLDRNPLLVLWVIWISLCGAGWTSARFGFKEILPFMWSIYLLYSFPIAGISFLQCVYRKKPFWFYKAVVNTISVLVCSFFISWSTMQLCRTAFLFWLVFLTEGVLGAGAFLCIFNYSNYKYTAKKACIFSSVYWIVLGWYIYRILSK